MSKEEFLKIQTCVLKVNIHCDGCKQKVKKILQKIDGVYTTNIDSEQGKVTVSGNVDPATLIKKLTKNGKHAEIWGASKTNNNNQNQMNNQFKNLQIDNGSKGGQNKGQTPKGGGNNQPKVGLQAQNPQFQQQLQLLQQQMQQLKGSQDLKIPPQFMKDLKGANNNKDQNQKSANFNMPEDEEYSDDDFDDDDYDDEDDDFDDEVDDIPVVNNKMKPPVLGDGHGGAQMGNIMMNNIMNGQHPQLMKGGGNNGGNGKKGGGGGGGGSNVPVQMNLGGGNQNQGGANGGKKGGNGNNNGGNQNQGGGKGGKNGGGQPNDGKNGGGGGNGQNKNGGGAGAGAGAWALNGNNSMGNGARKEGGMNDGPRGMPPMSAGGNMGPLGANLPMGQMGNLPMGQMNNLTAVQGLPAPAITGGGGGGAGYFPAATPEHMTANPYYQQQLAAMMMNQQRANGNERFQPMMYARPPPAVNYMPPYPAYPYQYPYAPPQGERTDQYAMFSDENTSSCNVM